jgi:hypothetical protein
VSARDTGYDINIQQTLARNGEPITTEAVQASIVDVDPDDIKNGKAENPEVSLHRTCIICNGRRYCITNGCAGTPCGWICG